MPDLVIKILSLIGIPKIIELILAIFGKSKLKILPLDPDRDIRTYDEVTGKWTRLFANLHIEYKGRKPAVECYAILNVLKRPSRAKHLYKSYYIHWADVPYSWKAKAPEPIRIFRGETRLDVAFTQKRMRLKGCWLAVPLFLSKPTSGEAFLPNGRYEFEIEICSSSAKGDKKKYKLFSPKEWENLDIQEL